MQLLPMMGGMLVTSIVSGRLISRLGSYRMFPILGTLTGGIAMALLSTLTLDTPLHTMYTHMALLGIGLGMVMPVLTLAVQNTVEFRHMGVATSGATLFRSIGGSLGVAAFGALFSHGLQSRVMAALPAGTALPPALGPAAVHQLPDAVRDAYLHRSPVRCTSCIWPRRRSSRSRSCSRGSSRMRRCASTTEPSVDRHASVEPHRDPHPRHHGTSTTHPSSHATPATGAHRPPVRAAAARRSPRASRLPAVRASRAQPRDIRRRHAR